MRRNRFIIIVVLTLMLHAISLSSLYGIGNIKAHWKEGQLIVNYKSGIHISRIMQIAEELDCRIIYRSRFANFITVEFDVDKDITELIKAVELFPEVLFAEPNGIVYAFWTPNDPYFQYQWNFGEDHLNMPIAWDIEQGGDSSVIVSILDTGIAYEYYLIPSYERDSVESNDGYYHISPDLVQTRFVTGFDIINNDSHPNDMNGHGTHICGTLAQSTNNSVGVAGMAFNVSIMPIRVLNACGSASCDQVADGIYFAYQNGGNVLNMSLGGAPGDSTGFGTVHQAIIEATNAGAVVIAAAGNSGDGQLSYPAGFEECVAVGATDIDTDLTPYSQWGEGIDVVAPGGDLYDTIPGTNYPAGILQSTYYQMNDGYSLAAVDSFTYHFLQGTCMATPHVSALAVLLISQGITDPDSIKQMIYSTCIDLGPPGYDLYFGHGLIYPPASLGAGVEETKKELNCSIMRLAQNPIRGNFIEFELSLPKKESIELNLYDLLGRQLRNFTLAHLSAGRQKIRLDAKGLPSGTYFLKLNTGPLSQTEKIILLR